MQNNPVSYIKADDDKLINENSIKWIQKINECLEVCTVSTGCNIKYGNTHKICKMNNPESYSKLCKFWEYVE